MHPSEMDYNHGQEFEAAADELHLFDDKNVYIKNLAAIGSEDPEYIAGVIGYVANRVTEYPTPHLGMAVMDKLDEADGEVRRTIVEGEPILDAQQRSAFVGMVDSLTIVIDGILTQKRASGDHHDFAA